MDKPSFSVVCIARNEEKTLPRLVASLSDFKKRGGEIIILDTGSSDATAQIARDLGCIVHEVADKFRVTIDEVMAQEINIKFCESGDNDIVEAGQTLFDYASARNYAATLSTNDMISMPDCDEIFTAFDIDLLNDRIKNGATQFEYNFVFAHDESGKPIVQFTHSKFYDRTKMNWVGVIHEVLSGTSNKEFITEDKVKLEHYQNVETNRSGYLVGLAYDCFINPDNDRNAHYFARELMYRGYFTSAIAHFKRHIAMDKWVTENAQSMIFIGDCFIHLGKEDEALAWYVNSFGKEPNRREPLMKLAEHYYRKQMPQQALSYAIAALEIKGTSYYANYEPYYQNIPHEILYWGYWQLGNKEKSKEHFWKAFNYAPTNAKYMGDSVFYKDEEGDLPFTGERLVPEKMINRQDMMNEHMSRYKFASQFTEGLNVLDGACGAGYGKEILKAQNYYGLDVDEPTIAHAIKKYGDGFFVEDLEKGVEVVRWPIDVTVSFETLEHLEDSTTFLKWVRANSKIFIFSIPLNMPSEFHKHVYSQEQAMSLIMNHFEAMTFYGQDAGSGEIGKLTPESQYLVGIAFSEMPKMSFVIPTLGREAGLERCLKSIDALVYPHNMIETIVLNDEPRLGVPKRVEEGYKKSTGEWIIYGANDIEFTPNSLLLAYLDHLRKGKKLIAFNTGEVSADQGNICEHFMIHRSLVEEIGQIFDTDFNHCGVDNLLWHKAKNLMTEMRSDRAVVHHYHFSKGYPMDDVYEKGWENVEEDRELLKIKLNQ